MKGSLPFLRWYNLFFFLCFLRRYSQRTLLLLHYTNLLMWYEEGIITEITVQHTALFQRSVELKLTENCTPRCLIYWRTSHSRSKYWQTILMFEYDINLLYFNIHNFYCYVVSASTTPVVVQLRLQLSVRLSVTYLYNGLYSPPCIFWIAGWGRFQKPKHVTGNKIL